MTGMLESESVSVPLRPVTLTIKPLSEQLLQSNGTLNARLTVIVLTVQARAVLCPISLSRISGATTLSGHPPPARVAGTLGNGPAWHSP